MTWVSRKLRGYQVLLKLQYEPLLEAMSMIFFINNHIRSKATLMKKFHHVQADNSSFMLEIDRLLLYLPPWKEPLIEAPSKIFQLINCSKLSPSCHYFLAKSINWILTMFTISISEIQAAFSRFTISISKFSASIGSIVPKMLQDKNDENLRCF